MSRRSASYPSVVPAPVQHNPDVSLFVVEEITASNRLRKTLNEAVIHQLVESIPRIGLKSPLVVRTDLEADTVHLVVGAHRLEACRRLGYQHIHAIEFGGTETDARLWEIAENLHRAELTPLERAEHQAEWIRLKGAQVAPPGGKQPHDKGIKAAVRDLGVDRTELQRSVKIAALPDEAKDLAREIGLDTNQSALLRAAASEEPAEELRRISNHRTIGTGNNEWFTPAVYVDAARAVLGGIDLDPASHPIAQRTVQAATFYTAADDGLTKQWHGTVFLNPPYAQALIGQFIDKLIVEHGSGRVSAAILLTHAYTDTAWFHTAASAAQLTCCTRGRIRFIGIDGEACAPAQGQAFFYFGKHTEAFEKTFSEFGLVGPLR